MHYTVYKTTNILNNKTYVGKHQTEDINDSYLGSGILLKEAIKQHGKSKFIKEVLFVYDNESAMNAKEIEVINAELVNRRDTYNVAVSSEETKLKLSTSKEDARNKVLEKARARKQTDETKIKLST